MLMKGWCLLIRDPVSRLLCCYLRVTIATVGSRWSSSCTWREGRVGNALDSRRVNIVVDDKGLLLVRVLRNCHVVVCVSRLPLSLPLPSDRVPVVVAAAVVFRLPLPDRVSVLVALGGKDIMVTKMYVVDAVRGLLRSKTNKQTNKR